MKQSEVEKLSPEQRRVATAELCGWKDVAMHPWQDKQPGETCHVDTTPVLKGIRLDAKWKRMDGSPVNRKFLEMVPDYLSDLNAMAEAESKIPVDKIFDYAYSVADVVKAVGDYEGFNGAEIFEILSATAEQRNLAFLMVMMEDKQ